jgi:nitrite reductase (cytochrome c-552)
MRSYVCGQCHVEYYCGKGMTIFFPWAEGLKVEQMERLYDGMQVKGSRFKDWTHAETGMEVLKAQHPEFEIWSQGIHAKSGVACADCHMSYKREGALKVSEHWVRSPLLSANRSCATCHPYNDEELKARVIAIQDRHFALMSRAGGAAVNMIDAIVAVRKPYDERNRPAALAKARETLEKKEAFLKGSKEDQDRMLAAETKANLLAMWRAIVEKDPALTELGNLQRASQWRLDFVAAENSMGFHAPQEMARILAESIDLSRQAEIKAAGLKKGPLAMNEPVPAAPAAGKATK